MDKNNIWKWLILALFLIFSLWVVYPPSQKIRKGIDIQGGTSFTVEIDKERILKEIRLRTGGKAPTGSVTNDPALLLLDAGNGGGIGATAEELKILNKQVKRAPDVIDVLRNRIDSIGINDPVIYPGPNGRIIIQMPGIGEDKLKEAETSILSAAFLEFRLVHKRNTILVQNLFDNGEVPEGFKAVPGEKMYIKDRTFKKSMDREFREKLGMFAVPNMDYEFMLKDEEVNGRTFYKPCFVKRRSEMTGDHLKNAMVGVGSLNQSLVNIEFDGKGAKDFARVTENYGPNGPMNMESNIGRQLAIVLDGKLYSAPEIRGAIFGGRAEITGSFTPAEARLLANILSSGSLPAPVKIVQKRYVSPSLGEASINSSIRAIVLGGISVIVFMLFYYLLSGVIADIALLLNMLLLPLGMIIAAGFLSLRSGSAAGRSALQLPVLTLPGMAGILLTIGMAVDANVLIFERIREESRKGKTLWTTIVDGYDKAFVTIMDANLTTLLTGVILFIFGSGPIRGFAVTLCAGILVSMFTALVVTKLLFGLVASCTKNMGVIRMLSIVKETSIDFISMRKIAATVSILLIIVSCGIMLMRGQEQPSQVFAVDFMGGTSLTFNFKDDISVCRDMCPVEGIRNAMEEAGVKKPFVQYQEDIKKDGTGVLL
ncbi:MAG: protein translocase subunit SecD, partial [Kiritimatiellae bacterium]|nr:protein translocase subunit SecD [Kiritimatiellia bacterium]